MKYLAQELGLKLKSSLRSATSGRRAPRRWLLALLGAASIALTSLPAQASLLITEDFNYTAGTPLTNVGWTAESGAFSNPLKAQSPGLTYGGYLSSGIGLACPMTTSGEDDSKSLGSSISSGSVYYSLLINVTAASATGDYFATLWTSGSGQNARLYIKSIAGGFNIGVLKDTASATVSYAPSAYTFGTTYLVVVKYTFKTGSTTDDTVDLFINPTPGGTEPAATLTHTGGSTDPSNLNRFVLRQGTASTAPTVAVDGIRVATTWAEAAASTCTPPTATVSGSASICRGDSTTIQAALTGTGPWNVTWSDTVTQSAVASSPATRSVSPTSTTSYTVTAVSDSTGCIPGTFSGTATVTVRPLPVTSAITGPAAVCAGELGVHFSVNLTNGSSYAWTVPSGASISSGATGPNNNEIVVTFAAASGTVTATETSAAGCVGSPVSKSVTVNPLPSSSPITGPAAVCAQDGAVHYSVTLTSGSSYAWTVPSGASISSGASGPNNNEIVVAFGTTGGAVTVAETSASGCVGSLVSQAVTVNPLPSTSAISGSATVAQNQTAVHYSVSLTSGSSYAWTVPGGASITSGASGPGNNEIVVTFGSASGNVTVQETSAAGCLGSVQSFPVGVEGPPTITGQPADQTACSGNIALFTVSASGAGSVGYQWRRDGTNLINGDNISGADTATLTINPVGAADAVGLANGYDCNVTNEYGSVLTSPKVVLTVNPLPASFNITGGGSYCAGGAGVSLGLDGSASGVTYTLKRASASVTSLPGSGAALDFGLQSVAGTYSVVATNDATLCGVALAGTVAVSVNPVPSTSAISGSTAVCTNVAGVTYSVTPTTASSYAWTVPSGASMTAGATGPDNNQITVTFGAASGNVTVTETSAAGCVGAPVSLAVGVSEPIAIALQPANATAVLASTVQLSVTASGVTSYQWEENSGSGWNPVSGGSGGTTATYTTASLAASDNAKQYRCQLSNGCGTLTSNAATLSVASFARSKTSGNWSDPATWEWSLDGLSFNAAVSVAPTSANSASIKVQASHNVTVTAAASADELTLEANGQITVASSQTLTIANGSGTDLTIAGFVDVSGTLTISSGAAVVVNSGGLLRKNDGSTVTTTGTLSFNAGAKYQHNNTTTAGTIPTATWNAGSTCEILGYTSNTSNPNGLGQAFYNFTWNCASQTGNINLADNLTNILGDFTFAASGASGSLRLAGTTVSSPISIAGNLSVQGGALVGANNTGVLLINVAGNLTLTGGSFDLKNSTGATGGGCTLNLGGNLSVGPGATLTGSSGTRQLIFSGSGTQTYANAGTVSGNIAWSVNAGSTVDLGTNVISGTSATFTLSSGGGLKTAHASGFNGNLTVSGAKALSTAGNYIYNGSVAQVTGSLLPATVNNLTIANTAAVVQLSQDLAGVSGTLTVNPGATLDFDAKAVSTATAPALNGALLMQVSKSGPNSFSGSKLTQSAGTLAYGGSLTVSATGSPLASGDVIVLFVSSASLYSGAFSAVVGPAVPAGLVRDVTQLTAGTGGNIVFGCDGTLAASAGPAQTICAGSGVAIGGSPAASGGSGSGYTFAWSPALGLSSSAVANPTASPSATTVYTLMVSDPAGCAAQSQVTVTVNPLPTTSAISGSTSVNANQAGVHYSVALTSGASYAWTVPTGATITSGANGPDNNEVIVTFGSAGGNITVVETSAAGCAGSLVSMALSVQNLLPVSITDISADPLHNAADINYTGGAGSQFVLLQSQDLTAPLSSWTRVLTNTATPGVFHTSDGSLASPMFWGVKSE